ncbi:uncharacterized protein TNCV_2760711 [Trichonephila clavipes]|nr:uncharacterized protein TNCV_2760711 [Trichonephila clavipes]
MSSSSEASMLQQVRERGVAWIFSLPWSTVYKVLRHILWRYPYKIKMLQQLKSLDDTIRIDFANFVLSKIRENDTWIQRICDGLIALSTKNSSWVLWGRKRQILSNQIHKRSLRDRRQSQLLIEMQNLFDFKMDYEVLRTFWQQCLYVNFQQILSVCGDSLDNLAMMAEKANDRSTC